MKNDYNYLFIIKIILITYLICRITESPALRYKSFGRSLTLEGCLLFVVDEVASQCAWH